MDQEDWGSLAVHSMPMSSDSRTELTTFLEVALELATHFLETWLDLPSNTNEALPQTNKAWSAAPIAGV